MEQKHEWKQIWEARISNDDILECGDPKHVLLELKRLDGFDVVGDGLSYEAFCTQCDEIRAAVSRGVPDGVKSIFEVGCGSGANLFLWEQAGLTCGGIDYSKKLVSCARQVLRTEDILCADAAELPVEPQYDAIISNSVFGYFLDESYAEAVLEKMVQKTRHSIGVTEVFDSRKQADFLACRKALIPNYEERYRNLPRLFYSKGFFAVFAKKHNLDIVFTDSNMNGYWNNAFIFNCYMYKR